MNAYELADKCGLKIDDYGFAIEIRDMLRQQADEIKCLHQILRYEGVEVGKEYLDECVDELRKANK